MSDCESKTDVVHRGAIIGILKFVIELVGSSILPIFKSLFNDKKPLS